MSEVRVIEVRRVWAWTTAVVVVLSIGLTMLVGELFQVRLMTVIVPGGPATTPTNIVLTILAGVAVALSGCQPVRAVLRWTARMLALVVMLLAAVALVRHFTQVSLPLDNLPAITDAAIGHDQPIRSPVGFLLLGLSLVTLDVNVRRGRPIAQLSAAAVAVFIGFATLASVLGLASAHPAAHASITPLPVQAVLLLLALALLISRADGLAVEIIGSPRLGGRTVRRLGPAVLGVVTLVTAAIAVAARSSVTVNGLLLNTVAGLLMMTLYIVFLRVGYMLNVADASMAALLTQVRRQRDFSATVLNTLVEGVLVTELDGTIVRASPRWCQLTGYSAEEVVGQGRPYPWLITPSGLTPLDDLGAAVVAGACVEFDAELQRPDGTRMPVLVAASAVPGEGDDIMVICTYRDLTERERVQGERNRVARQLDHFFTMSKDLLCFAGADGYFQRVNPAWTDTLGYPPEELTSQPFINFVHPDDVERTIAEMARLTDGSASTADFANRYRARDGSYRWLSWHATAGEGGRTIYAVARDETEQRAAAEASAQLAAIVESTADAVIGKTLDGTIVSWNPAAERIYGYSPEEIIGRNIAVLFTPDQKDLVADLNIRLARGETVREHDITRVRGDGKLVHLALTISPVRDSDGNITGAASIAHDITDAKRAERRFRQLVLSAPDAMIVVDSAGLIRLANEQVERMFGYGSQSLIGQSVETLVPDLLVEGHAQARLSYTADPDLRPMEHGRELSGRRHDGTEFPVEISLAPFDSDEGMLYSAAIRDISERKKTELVLAAARDEALAAAQVKSQFVAMVSHEIRTPMNGVIGLTNLLLNTPLQPVQQRYGESILTSARALLTIINDILDFSKIEAGKITLVEEDFYLGNLLEEVAHAAAAAARDKDVEVLTYYPSDLPAVVHGDAGRLRQVLLNLAGNAVKFTPQGEVVLRVDESDAVRDGRREFTFSVSDTGIGIDPARISELFEPFAQADSSTSRQFGGTGLGLSISRQLVGFMGGELQVASAPGEGTCFQFTVALGGAPESAGRLHRLRDELATWRMLVVDSNETMRQFLAEHIQAWGMKVATTSASEEAYRWLASATRSGQPYNMVIVNHRPPHLDGIAFADHVGGDPRDGRPTCIVLSRDPATEEFLQDHPHVHFLAKPVGPSALYDFLLEHFRPQAAAPDEGAVTPASTGTRGRILLAEDNEINQLVAVDTLAALGYETEIASNGAEAVELARANEYQAILMDCQMPSLDGFEATRRLREEETPERHTPIIAMTAGVLTEDRQRAYQAGMDDFLAKPIDPDGLRAVLDRWTRVVSR